VSANASCGVSPIGRNGPAGCSPRSTRYFATPTEQEAVHDSRIVCGTGGEAAATSGGGSGGGAVRPARAAQGALSWAPRTATRR
jgi:hypothetical protein